ncbi:hypothetical protein [Clostridium tyrobutyricum]|uniref:hypothetical protein n=1 Tax=Clostridium tyrobutyricum TaxID=1519 RepID=UPI0030D25CCC
MLKRKYKLISALVIAAPLFLNTGVTSMVHASGLNSNKPNTTCNSRDKQKQTSAKAAIVKATPAKADTIKCNYKFGNYSYDQFKVKLDTPVSQGVITKAQETTILNLFVQGKLTPQNFDDQLDVLITKGNITSTHKTKLLNLFGIAPAKAAPAKTAPVKCSYKFGSYSYDQFKVKLDTLVSQGVITKAQETTILNLFVQGKLTPQNFDDQLNVLITKGNITSTHKTKLLNLFGIAPAKAAPAKAKVAPVKAAPAKSNQDSHKKGTPAKVVNSAKTAAPTSANNCK